MDKRDTLIVHDSFLKILESLKEGQQVASMLVDDGGISREEGKIMDINKEDPETRIYLSNGKVIRLKTIVAVNGIFLSDYSEC